MTRSPPSLQCLSSSRLVQVPVWVLIPTITAMSKLSGFQNSPLHMRVCALTRHITNPDNLDMRVVMRIVTQTRTQTNTDNLDNPLRVLLMNDVALHMWLFGCGVAFGLVAWPTVLLYVAGGGR